MGKLDDLVSKLNFAYQPIREIKSGDVIGYEALLRGVEKLNFNTPLDLFNEAYKINHLFALDVKLREKAIQNISNKIENTDLKLFYNYDSRALEWDCFTKDITENILEKHNISNNNFCYDFNNEKSVISTLFYFLINNRNKGLHMSISNSMIELFSDRINLNIKPDYIRINKKIVCEAKNNKQYRNNLESLVNFTKSKKLQTIAVFVEKDEELKLCQDFNIDLVQGFYTGEPSFV